jgi:hypothetical protein
VYATDRIALVDFDPSRIDDLAAMWRASFARNRGARAFYERNGFVAIAHGIEPTWRLDDNKYQWVRANEKGPRVDISRKTGYKIFQRYKELGLEGLTDRSRRPFRQANKLPLPIETLIVQLKREHPGWGAPKIREKSRQRDCLSAARPQRGRAALG